MIRSGQKLKVSFSNGLNQRADLFRLTYKIKCSESTIGLQGVHSSVDTTKMSHDPPKGAEADEKKDKISNYDIKYEWFDLQTAISDSELVKNTNI